MISNQQSIVISKYLELYDLLIPITDPLRKINDMVDFSFVFDEVSKHYSDKMGRNAEDPIRLFKYLMLKDMHELSDRDLLKRTLTDLSFKYFLGLAPEETQLIHPTTLTKFRRLRLKDESILDLLVRVSLQTGMNMGIDIGRTLVVDATHTHARYHQKSLEDILLDRAKKLRRDVYRVDESIRERFPKKLNNPSLNEIISYCEEILDVVTAESKLQLSQSILEKSNFLREGISDTETALKEVAEPDAKVGHKAKDNPFFGYKTHIAMSENRFITSAILTTGEKPDGQELQLLIEKSVANGMTVEEVIGDTAYSGKDNLDYAKGKAIKLISKLHPVISQGSRQGEDKFSFNKDAGLYACPAGHLAIRKAKTEKKDQNKNQRRKYYFDVEKCKNCIQREGCYEPDAKSKTYSVSIISTLHQEQMHFQETDYFKERYRQRYMIEAKNSELKNQHGYGVAISGGLFGMRIQGAISIFNVNIKRILTILQD